MLDMRRYSFLLCAMLLLCGGCAAVQTPPSPPSASSSVASSLAAGQPTTQSNAVTVTLEKSTSTDAQATVHTKAVLHLSGAVMKAVDLGDILGELRYVNHATYDLYRQKNGDPVAVLSAWWAGGGEEFVLTQFHDPHYFTIEKRYGDESGNCDPPGLVGDYPLQGDITVSLQNFGEPVDQSSLQFCHQKK